ncbi:MAG: L-threonylcarbamoyladenylate synthase [Bacteroidales bacterium]
MEEEIKNTLEILKNGGVILYPTDTIWGIGCDATNEKAVKRIFEIKEREDNKSMLVLVDDANRIPSYIDTMPEIAWDLIEFTTKPLTIIYSGAKNLAKNLIGSDGTIGIRVSSEPFTKKLVQRFKKPIVSTSANISGQPFAAKFSQVDNEIIKKVDYVVNYRREENIEFSPSSIIQLGVKGEIKIIRE